ncbi:NAD(P)-binding protein [Marasmius fiardii PR-910]|nr:NAD(P)-binding protein [Marasmius fiardii PR-910]
MAILLTGGTGKTSSRIASLLQGANVQFLLASRRALVKAPQGMTAVQFDWTDPSTYENPFLHQFPGGEKITAIYLVAPEVHKPFKYMIEFVELALKKHGVKRFVLMGGADIALGEPLHTGKVWQRLLDLGVEYCVLRPPWFMDNLATQDHVQHVRSIKEQRKIYSATGSARIAFVSAIDIARVALRALVDENPHNTEYLIYGPELLSYDEIAAKISKVIGSKVVHVKLDERERAKVMVQFGAPEPYANFLAKIEAVFGSGRVKEVVYDDVQRVTGQPPESFDSFAERNKAIWL